MKLDFEYGHGLMSAELPDSTDVFIPGETVRRPAPACRRTGTASTTPRSRASATPSACRRCSELAAPGQPRWSFVIPDIVKGGNQPTSHRKVAIRACLDELYAAGVEKKDVLLLFSNGLHPRATVAEMQDHPGRGALQRVLAAPARSPATTPRTMTTWWTWASPRRATT